MPSAEGETEDIPLLMKYSICPFPFHKGVVTFMVLPYCLARLTIDDDGTDKESRKVCMFAQANWLAICTLE